MKNLLKFLLVVLACAYALLLAKPELYFNKSLDYKGFTVRARGALPASMEGSLDSAAERIAASELFTAGTKFEVILPASRGQFIFFAPLQKGGYFRVSPFHGAIFLASADFTRGEARKAAGDTKYRSLSGAIAAGAAFEMTRRKLRPLTYIFMNDWKVRGYAEILSGGTGDFTPPDACGEALSPEQLDYKYGLILQTVLKEENIFYDDLLDKNLSLQNAELRLKRAHCGG